MSKVWIIAFIIACLSPRAVMAEPTCGAAFNGWWSTGVISAGGQYTQNDFANLTHNGLVHAGSRTSLRINSLGNLGSSILSIEFDNGQYKNITAKSISRNECLLTFKRPHVSIDKYGAMRQYIARRAKITVSGRTMRWCWQEKGHQLGDCTRYRRD